MNTCGTCKYLGEPVAKYDDDDNNIEPVYHRCNLIVHLTDEYDRARKHRLENQIAYVIDASDYHATLCVKDEFGCNQWVQK